MHLFLLCLKEIVYTIVLLNAFVFNRVTILLLEWKEHLNLSTIGRDSLLSHYETWDTISYVLFSISMKRSENWSPQHIFPFMLGWSCVISSDRRQLSIVVRGIRIELYINLWHFATNCCEFHLWRLGGHRQEEKCYIL